MSFDKFFDKVERKNKIVFIDGHNIFYRCLHVANHEYKKNIDQFAFGNLTTQFTKQQMWDLWKHLVLSNIIAVLNEHSPTRLILCVDSKDYWRKGVYADYKGNRKAARDASDIDYEEFFQVLDQFVIELSSCFSTFYCLRIPSCETDDIIAVLTKKFAKLIDNEITIVSTDKDFFQLQKYKNVKQYDPLTKKFIVCANPIDELDVKVLTGDKGDNIPPIRRGVGPVTAKKLLISGLDETFKDPLLKENYIRNRTLISFEYIPLEISNIIDTEFSNYQLKPINAMKIMSFLLKNNLTKISEELQILLPKLKKLN